MRIVGVIQVRMNSQRLPGKVIRDVNGLPMLWHIYRRLLGCLELDDQIVAIGGDGMEISDVCTKYSMKYVHGPEDDLLSRLWIASIATKADAILRVTGDCLFHDPKILDEMIHYYRLDWPNQEHLANWPARYVSEGLDAEIWSVRSIAEMNGDRTRKIPRENFASYMVERGLVAQYKRMPLPGHNTHMSIDTEEDLQRAQRVLAKIGNDDFNYINAANIWDYV